MPTAKPRIMFTLNEGDKERLETLRKALGARSSAEVVRRLIEDRMKELKL